MTGPGPHKSHDEWVLDAFEDRMRTFPHSPVFALNDWSIQIDVPEEIDVTGRPPIAFRAPADLGPPSELGSLMAVWTGMERQGYRLHLTNAEVGVWRATFSRHAMTSAEGFGAAATPWGAVQEAAWGALKDDPGSAHAA